ncbi:MAG TPA: hypothetical protein VKH81_23240 [Candidatus Angelobacter sp.]|nr:hypothetical protein [Candidatus Angelobacter sp.]
MSSFASSNTDSLLAMRVAGAAFTGPYNLRSATFEQLIQDYENLTERVATASQTLVQELHASVPRAANVAQRHVILQIKRKVFNLATVPDQDLGVLHPEQQERLRDYCRLLGSRDKLLDEHRSRIFQEFRQQLDTLCTDKEFLSAVNYSCPWLMDAYRRHGPGTLQDFSHEERGIAAYAMRFFSKANPFHCFSRIAFPPYLGLQPDGPYEVLVNSAAILQLEKYLLQRFPGHAFIYLRSFQEQAQGYDFFISADATVRRITVPKNRTIELVIDYFKTDQPCRKLDHCIDYLTAALKAYSRNEIENYLRRLIESGILAEYLVPDFNRFADFLLGIDPEVDPLISRLQKVHTVQFTMSDLLRAEDDVARIAKNAIDLQSPLFYINAYSEMNTAEGEADAGRLSSALQALKPLLLAGNNYADWAYVTRAFMKDYCRNCPDHSSPYLTLLAEFFRDMRSVLSQYQPQRLCPPEEQEARRRWLQRLTECEGTLSDEQLQMLMDSRPAGERFTGPICFNGPMDHTSGIYYPHNFFSGNGRYLSRYLLAQTGKRTRGIAQEENPLHVQIVPAFEDNRMYVTPMLAAGCGFEARYRHQFDRWIDPGEINVKLEQDEILYQQASSGRCLQFHFFGFLLGQLLRPEYQLLLIGHADFFYNLFERSPAFGQAIQHVPPLYYKSICLRREQWRFPKTFFDPTWKHTDILRCTLELRKELREAGIDFRHSYFQLIDSPVPWHKPRYLDLCSPLGTHIFRRAVRSCSANTMVSLARMEPEPKSLLREGRCSYVTELMIEV